MPDTSEPLGVSVHKVTDDFRGDHAADVSIALTADFDETLGDLLRRADLRAKDYLEIRIMVDHA